MGPSLFNLIDSLSFLLPKFKLFSLSVTDPSRSLLIDLWRRAGAGWRGGGGAGQHGEEGKGADSDDNARLSSIEDKVGDAFLLISPLSFSPLIVTTIAFDQLRASPLGHLFQNLFRFFELCIDLRI